MAMTDNDLTYLLKPGFQYRSPGFFTDNEAEETIWDQLARINSTQAALAVSDEEHERVKSAPLITWLMEELVNDQGLVLDLGCGYGRVAKYLFPQRTFRGWIGLDSSVVMLSKFADLHQKSFFSKPPLLLIKSDIAKIPLPDNAIDYCIVTAVFLHNPKHLTRQSLQEIYRVLKPGGRVVIAGCFVNSLTLAGFYQKLILLSLASIGQKDKNGPIRCFYKKEVRKILEETGFSNSQLFFYERNLSFMPINIIPPSWLRMRPFLKSRIAQPVDLWLARNLPQKLVDYLSNFDVVAVK